MELDTGIENYLICRKPSKSQSAEHEPCSEIDRGNVEFYDRPVLCLRRSQSRVEGYKRIVVDLLYL